MYYADLNLASCMYMYVKLVTELSHKFYHVCVCVGKTCDCAQSQVLPTRTYMMQDSTLSNKSTTTSE